MLDDFMLDIKWFEGSMVNYVEYIFCNWIIVYFVLMVQFEIWLLYSFSWVELEEQVVVFVVFLQVQGVEKGDRVVGFLANIEEVSIVFLVVCLLGVVWLSCLLDFGISSVMDCFQ